MIARLAEADREPTDDERSACAGCSLVAMWEQMRGESVELRRATCKGCALNTGAWPRVTPLYATAEEFIAWRESEIPNDRKYSDRERQAILVVDTELKRARASERKPDGSRADG